MRPLRLQASRGPRPAWLSQRHGKGALWAKSLRHQQSGGLAGTNGGDRDRPWIDNQRCRVTAPFWRNRSTAVEICFSHGTASWPQRRETRNARKGCIRWRSPLRSRRRPADRNRDDRAARPCRSRDCFVTTRSPSPECIQSPGASNGCGLVEQSSPHPAVREAAADVARGEPARCQRRLRLGYSRSGDARRGRHRIGSGCSAVRDGHTNRNRNPG